ncbi:unnamed protein product [Cladocopium goreaui]|uniref:Copia protein n=1 Tax=Cladocopium goreaui TaxID=2562237 RepID=A0A9P1CYZ1_9DINO|nr:unnamed protein product [Cladocopium goreaui]
MPLHIGWTGLEPLLAGCQGIRAPALFAGEFGHQGQHVQHRDLWLLTRLQGEAYRATEHLAVADLRRNDGWLQVIRALDTHYAFLPETELHEAIDSFLFDLRKKPHEGATAFASRFKTALSRVQALIAQERSTAKTKKVGKKGKGSVASAEPDNSSLEPSDDGSEPGSTSHEPAAAPVDASAEASGQAAGSVRSETPAPKAAASPPGDADEQRTARSHDTSEQRRRRHSSRGSRGTHSGDRKKEELKMAYMLGTIEVGHTKPSPIFPSTVLGHLFMRKYGLSREQRAQVIRATGGSSRFAEVERILRASDFDESRSRHDERRPHMHHGSSRTPRRESYAVAHREHDVHAMEDDSSDLQEPLTSGSGSDDAYMADQHAEGPPDRDENDSDLELQEIYEMKQKAKKDFKKSFKTYKESRRRVKEIKKARQPYYPVVALSQPGDSSASTLQPANASSAPKKQEFRYDKSKQQKVFPPKRQPRKEDAHFTTGTVATDFAYMVVTQEWNNESPTLDVLLASIPDGCAIIDTGCTTSVIGLDTAVRFQKLFEQKGLPSPEKCTLPAVELKGFSGDRRITTYGLKWTVKIGELWGTITTYVVNGPTPFLLSRRVLEGMEANLDMGKGTISSTKHGMKDVPLKRAANGHFLLPFCDEPSEFEPTCPPSCKSADVAITDATDGSPDVVSVSESETAGSESAVPSNEPNDKAAEDATTSSSMERRDKPPCRRTKKQVLQHVVKNTRKGVVNVDRFRNELVQLFGSRASECTHAYVAYRPRLERIPEDADKQPYLRSIATLTSEGEMSIQPWNTRAAGSEKARVVQTNIALYVYIPVQGVQLPPKPESEKHSGCHCLCCSEDYDQVLDELRNWLGPQAPALDSPVHMIEVFTDHAPLARKVSERTGKSSIILGLNHGQDFNRLQDRRLLMYLLAVVRPKHVWFSFPCGCWGPWSRFNIAKGGKSESTVLQQRKEARRHLRAVSEAWQLQRLLGGHCHAENPLTSEAWSEIFVGEVFDVRIDMCSVGMRCPKTNVPQMLRLAKRCKSSAEMQTAIKQFKCSVCEELKVTNRVLGHMAQRVWRTTSRPAKEDEAEFRSLARSLAEGRLHPELENAEQSVSSRSGQFADLTKEHEPMDEDHELEEDLWEESPADPSTDGADAMKQPDPPPEEVEVNYRKLSVEDKAKFEVAMKKVHRYVMFLSYGSVPDSWHGPLGPHGDAGHAKRANGDSQGGYLLGLTNPSMRDRKQAPMWLVDWASKKLKRVVKSSTAAETHAGINAMDAIEFFQALLAETIHGITPKQFRLQVPKHTALLVVDSRGFYDAASKLSSASTSEEKKLEIDYAIARQAMKLQNIEIYWINNNYMAADCLTQMSRKMQKSDPSAPLTPDEFNVVCHLVTRAAMNGQSAELFNLLFRENPGLSDLVKDDVAKGANSSMHDGSKRQRDVADPFDFPEGDSPCSSKWSEVTSQHPDKHVGKLTLSKVLPGVKLQENVKIPLGNEVTDIDDWSTTKLTMKKYESKGWRYSNLVEAAKNDKEVQKYMTWIVKTYGKDISEPCENQATDLARFLLRINWLEFHGGAGGYRRER